MNMSTFRIFDLIFAVHIVGFIATFLYFYFIYWEEGELTIKQYAICLACCIFWPFLTLGLILFFLFIFFWALLAPVLYGRKYKRYEKSFNKKVYGV